MKVELKQKCYDDTIAKLKEKYGSDAICVETPDGKGEITLQVFEMEMKYILNPNTDILIINGKVPIDSFSQEETKEILAKLRVKYCSLYPRLMTDHIALRETCFCTTDSSDDQEKLKTAPFSFIKKLEEIHFMFFNSTAKSEEFAEPAGSNHKTEVQNKPIQTTPEEGFEEDDEFYFLMQEDSMEDSVKDSVKDPMEDSVKAPMENPMEDKNAAALRDNKKEGIGQEYLEEEEEDAWMLDDLDMDSDDYAQTQPVPETVKQDSPLHDEPFEEPAQDFMNENNPSDVQDETDQINTENIPVPEKEQKEDSCNPEQPDLDVTSESLKKDEAVDDTEMNIHLENLKKENPAMVSEMETTIAEMNAVFHRKEQQLNDRRNALDEYAKFLDKREAELNEQKEHLQENALFELEEMRKQQESKNRETEQALSAREKEIEDMKAALIEERKQIDNIRAALDMRRTKLDAEKRSLDEWKKDIEEQEKLSKKMSFDTDTASTDVEPNAEKELPSNELNHDFFKKFYIRLERLISKPKPIEQEIDEKLDSMMKLIQEKSVIELPMEDTEGMQQLQQKNRELKMKLQRANHHLQALSEENELLKNENLKLTKENKELIEKSNEKIPVEVGHTKPDPDVWKNIIETDLQANGLELQPHKVEGRIIFSGKANNCMINFNLFNQVLCISKHLRRPSKYVREFDQLNNSNPFPDHPEVRLITYEISKDGLQIKAFLDAYAEISILIGKILASIDKMK